MLKPLLEVPADDHARTYHQLGYLVVYDAVLNSEYAFLVYTETDRDSTAWRMKIKSTHTEGATFEPAAVETKAREAGAKGKPYVRWGFFCEPTMSDPRQIEYRLHQEQGKPTAIELFVRLRTYEHQADTPQSLRFPWPNQPQASS